MKSRRIDTIAGPIYVIEGPPSKEPYGPYKMNDDQQAHYDLGKRHCREKPGLWWRLVDWWRAR